MKWRVVDKARTPQPKKGKYSEWKSLLALEANHQCAYCAIGEGVFGGIRNFHVEHFRPRSKFPALENDIKNLFYACAICNTFKGDDWPREPVEDHAVSSYPDPSVVDYSALFHIEEAVGTIKGRYVAAKYIEERLYLNRPQLIIERRTFFLYERLTRIREVLEEIQTAARGDISVYVDLLKAHKALSKIYCAYRGTIPYSAEDVKR